MTAVGSGFTPARGRRGVAPDRFGVASGGRRSALERPSQLPSGAARPASPAVQHPSPAAQLPRPAVQLPSLAVQLPSPAVRLPSPAGSASESHGSASEPRGSASEPRDSASEPRGSAGRSSSAPVTLVRAPECKLSLREDECRCRVTLKPASLVRPTGPCLARRFDPTRRAFAQGEERRRCIRLAPGGPVAMALAQDLAVARLLSPCLGAASGGCAVGKGRCAPPGDVSRKPFVSKVAPEEARSLTRCMPVSPRRHVFLRPRSIDVDSP